MKKHFLMNHLIIAVAILGLTGFTACNNPPDDAKEASEEQNEEMMDDRKSEKDAQFLVDAADISLMEIHLARLGAERATMQEVKDFGNKMEAEHQRSYEQLSALAASKNISIPGTVSEEGTKHHKNLSEKSGYDFDRKFCDDMADGHQKAIRKFEEQADDGSDTEIKAWAANMLPTLRSHLDEAKMLKEKVKDMK